MKTMVQWHLMAHLDIKSMDIYIYRDLLCFSRTFSVPSTVDEPSISHF